MASIKINRKLASPEIEPADVYGTEGPIRLKIATGGAGQSGLLRALAEAFIQEYVANTSCLPFRIAWLASDTSLSFNSLASGAADVSITYHAYAEKVAIRQGIADRVVYGWRDHWVFVGPKSNPAKLPIDGNTTIYELFSLLFQAAVETSTDPEPVRFLSRYDKSANNIAESRIWTAIGQTPWSWPYSPWYHLYQDFPFGALRVASKLGEYTLIDRGTWLSIEESTRERMVVFAERFDAEEADPMLNPAHALVGAYSNNKDVSNAFVDWLASLEGGQKVIRTFAVNGHVLYSPVPEDVDPFGEVNKMA